MVGILSITSKIERIDLYKHNEMVARNMRLINYCLLIVVVFNAVSFSQCQKDLDCKGDRICVDGECVSPSTQSIKNMDGCQNNSDCKGNRVCVEGECVEQTKMYSSQKSISINSSSVKLALIPKIGINISKLYGDDMEDYFEESVSARAGILIGADFLICFHKYFSLEPGFYFSMRGAKADGDGYDVKLNLNYLEFPIKAKLTFPTNTIVTPNVFFSPVIGVNVLSKGEVDEDGETDTEDLKDDTKGAEFAFGFGGGSTIDLNVGILSFDIRFLFGLTTVLEYSDDNRNWSISFIFGYGFKLIK